MRNTPEHDAGAAPQTATHHPWLRRLGLTSAALAALVAALWLALLTPLGLGTAAWIAERAVKAGTGFDARIENVSGTLPFSLTIGRLALSDAKGPWLILSDASLSWSPAALLRGRIEIGQITADIVRLCRAPEIDDSHRAPATFDWPPRFPRLPPILLDRLAVTRLILDKELTGQAAVITVSGRLAESGRGAAALSLTAERIDGLAPLGLSVGAALNYADWSLAIKARLTDAPGGLLATALAGPDAPEFTLEILGDGPLAAWKGHLSARLGAADILLADLGLGLPLAADARASFSLDLAARPTPGLLPPFFETFLGERSRLTVSGTAGLADSSLAVDAATVSGAFGSVSLAGSLDPDTDALAATGSIDITDASRLASALGGRLGAKLAITGPLSRPSLTADATARGFHAGPVLLADGDIKATAHTDGPIKDRFPGASLAATGRLAGLAGPDGTTLAGQTLDVTAKGRLTPDWIVDVDHAGLTGQGGTITLGQVHIDGGNVRGHLTVSLADTVGATSLVGLRLRGAATVAGDVVTAPDGQGTASLTASFAGLAAASPGDTVGASVAALLGPSPTLAIQAAFSAKGAQLTEMSLTGKGASLTGSGRYLAADDSLAAKATLAAPDLGLLAAALGRPCAGAVEARLTVSGPALSLRLDLSTEARQLHLGELALDAVAIEASLADSARHPAGKLAVSARREGEAARLETAYALAGPRLRLTGLQLRAPDAAFSGEADIETATGRVSGTLAGQAGNLAGLGRFVGLQLAGGLKLSATAAIGKTTGQSLTLDLGATNLRLPGLAAASLTAAASLDDLTGQPRGKAGLTAKGLDASGITLASLTAAATGDGRSLALTAETKGRLAGQTPLEAAVRASLSPAEAGARRLAVQSLAGSLDGRKFSLTAPAALTFGNGTLRADGVRLAFDKAKIAASGTIGPNDASGKIGVENFPLPLLALFGVAGLDGTATATATASLSGSPARPQVVAEAHVAGLRLASEQGRGLPAVGLWAKAHCTGSRLEITAGLVGKNGKDARNGAAGPDVLTLAAGLPARLSLDPFAFDLPPNGALSGSLKADADLTDLAGLLARANTRMTGRLTADMALGGSLAAPSATGGLALAASRLENADAGLVLTNVIVKADATGGTLTIASASGEDGRGGRFNLAGTVGIQDPANGPVDLTLSLAKLRVVGLDLATAAADGTVRLTGTLSRMRAAGTIVIGPADINLPTSLPPDVAVIPVTYINDPAAPKKAKAKAPPPAVAKRVDLDLTIDLGQAVFVRGLGLESRWTGQIAVTGTAAEPIVIGRYAVDKGSLDLLGSTLEITKGELAFTGGTPPAPTFDIRAETTKDSITAGIAISGDADNPTISLTSTPPLPRDEILSRLLFGQSAGSLSPIQAAQLAQAAASIYAGGTPTSILARTRRILRLDQLTIVPGKAGMAGTVLKAGKEIFKGVTVGVEQGMGAQSGAVSVEVQVTPNITVDSRVGTDNKQGVGVNWKWDY